MLRLGRPVGAYPRLEARLAAIHLGDRAVVEGNAEERTGCDECVGKDVVYDESCSDGGDETGDESDSDCECVTGKEFEKSAWFDDEGEMSY